MREAVRAPMRVLIAHDRAEKYAALIGAALPELDIACVSNAQAAERAGAADVLVTIGRWLTPDLATSCARLKWIQCLITGTDHLAEVRKARPDIVVTNARGVHGPQMAETAMLHVLSLSRGGRRLARQQQAHEAKRFVPMTLVGRTACLVGVGAIAEHFAAICKAFGMRVTGVTSRADVENFDRLHPRSALHEALGQADFVAAFVPLSPDTRGMFDAAAFAAMKRTGFFINMARGALVDAAALVAALEGGVIAGAGLDVFEDWPLPETSPLWDVENLLISPFIGGQSDRYEEMLAPIIIDNLKQFMAGRPHDMMNIVPTGEAAV